MDSPEIQLYVVVSAPFAENTYIAHIEGRADCLIVDPGFDTDQILDCLTSKQLTPAAILNTHGHLDHIAGNAELKRQFPDCPLVVPVGEVPKLSDPKQNLSAGMGDGVVSPPADVTLSEGETYQAAGLELDVLSIPGHSSGHVVFLWRAGKPMYVFGGDVLMAGSIGRTDFPDGDFEQLASGIRGKLFTLPDDTIVLPGHGPPTTTGQERRTNPFVGGE